MDGPGAGEKTMNRSFTNTGWIMASAVPAFSSADWIGTLSRADGKEVGVETKRVATETLGNVPGKKLTAIVVNYAPGGKSGAHRHAGSIFAYVLSGAIRSESSATGPAKVYRAGESFFEPPASRHLVSENASTKEPASLLAVFVADDGARLTVFDK
jgi:quercetin dioxygenase-like cupin family protein